MGKVCGPSLEVPHTAYGIQGQKSRKLNLQNAAESITTHLAQEIGPKQGRHHHKPSCNREATPKLSMVACIAKPFKTSMI